MGTGDTTNLNRTFKSYTDSVMEMCYLYDGVPVDRSSSTGRDADGTRVAKGRITAWSCDPAVNGFQTTSDYILGPSGEQVTEMAMDANNSMAWQHTNVYAGGALLATYDNDGLHFYLNDPLPGSPATGLRRWGGLGSRRAQTDYAGVLEQTCSSLPFGDALTCSGGNLQAPTEHHFTGKERDSESGNDYFGARYYSSSMGRFMSPDWSVKVMPVPYAKLDNPQSLNLYSYMYNNPLRGTDPDGHDGNPCATSTANSGCSYTTNEKTHTMQVTETNNTITKQSDSSGNVVSVTSTITTTKTTINMGNGSSVQAMDVKTDTKTYYTNDISRVTQTSSEEHLNADQAMDRLGSDRTAQLQDAATPSFWQNVKDHPITVGLGITGGVLTAAGGCATVVGCVPGIMIGETIVAGSIVATGTNK